MPYGSREDPRRLSIKCPKIWGIIGSRAKFRRVDALAIWGMGRNWWDAECDRQAHACGDRARHPPSLSDLPAPLKPGHRPAGNPAAATQSSPAHPQSLGHRHFCLLREAEDVRHAGLTTREKAPSGSQVTVCYPEKTRPWTGSWTGEPVRIVRCVHSGAGVLLSVQVAGSGRFAGLLVMRRSGVRFPKAAQLRG